MLPEQGFVFDVKQAVEADVAPRDMILAMGAHLKHVHVLDKGPNGYCLPGQGEVNWDGVFGALREVGFDGSIIL